MTNKTIPISEAERIAKRHGQNQVIIVTWDDEAKTTHVVTYGKTLKDCEQAAKGGNFVKRALGWPESLCNEIPQGRKKAMKLRGE